MADQDTRPHDDDLARIEQLLRELTPADLEQVAPPAGVWEGIEAELGLDARHGGTPGPSAPSPDTVGARDRSGAPVVSLDERRRSRSTWLLAVAAAAIVVIAGAVVVTRSGDSTQVVATAVLEHEADFDPLGAGAGATAELVERDGHFEIVLTDTTLPADLGDEADLELWLIEARDDGSLDVQPVSLLASTDGGSYRVPDDLDPRTHSVVDISIEPRDGDEAHSGRSILRGALA